MPADWALRHFVSNTTISFSQRRCERMGGQVLELGHAQVGDADVVGCCSVAPCGTFGRATHLKVDTPKRGGQVNLFDLPRRHQAQRAGEPPKGTSTVTARWG